MFIKTAISEKIALLPDGEKGRYIYAINSTNPDVFFDIYWKEGVKISNSPSIPKTIDSIFIEVSRRNFTLGVEFHPFSNKKIIDFLVCMKNIEIPIDEVSVTSDFDDFFNTPKDFMERGSDVVRVSVQKIFYFINALLKTLEIINKYKIYFKKYNIAYCPDDISNNLNLILYIIKDIKFGFDINFNGTNKSKFDVFIDNPSKIIHEKILKDIVVTQYHLPSNIISDYLRKVDCYKYLQEASFIMQLVEYSQIIRNKEEDIFGCNPEILETENGLYMNFISFHHPFLVENSTESMSFGNFSLGIPPSGDFGATIAILPAPNMSGKSTFMKSIGLILHSAAMARKVSAKKCVMTLPDRIFHNFNIEDDLIDQVSLFKAQLINIKEFMEKSTINSLGLFDELFNGTSSDYQLALVWTFLEFCEHRKLRVIVSTHNNDVGCFSYKDGYDRIKGIYKRMTPLDVVNDKVLSKNISIGKDRKVVDVTHNDSKALEVVADVFKDSEFNISERAAEILCHLKN